MNVLDVALRNKLIGDSALISMLGGTSVFNTLAPQGSTYPQVQFNEQAGTDDNDSMRRARQVVYLVKGVSQNGLTAAGAIDDRIDAILHHGALTVTGWGVFWTARESDVRYAEQAEDGRTYFHAGGLYRIRLETSP